MCVCLNLGCYCIKLPLNIYDSYDSVVEVRNAQLLQNMYYSKPISYICFHLRYKMKSWAPAVK